jgi:hypothetical protein
MLHVSNESMFLLRNLSFEDPSQSLSWSNELEMIPVDLQVVGTPSLTRFWLALILFSGADDSILLIHSLCEVHIGRCMISCGVITNYTSVT